MAGFRFLRPGAPIPNTRAESGLESRLPSRLRAAIIAGGGESYWLSCFGDSAMETDAMRRVLAEATVGSWSARFHWKPWITSWIFAPGGSSGTRIMAAS